MSSGENSTADSMTKMHDVLSERMLLESSRMSSANWQRAQRLAWGENHREADFKADEEMILVDSTITINHAPPIPQQQRPTSPSPVSQSGTDFNPGSPAKTSPVKSAGALAKLVAGAALVASGAGAGVGIPLLLSGGKDVVEQVTKPTQQATSETPAKDAAGSASKAVRYVLELGK